MSLDPSEGIALVTDGSAHYADGSGGFAWIALDAFDGMDKYSGHRQDATNNQMELLAVSDGLRETHRAYGPCEVLVYSDSEYVVLGINRGHKRNKNIDYWRDLDAAIALHEQVLFHHVKGHADNLYNLMADEMAGAARKALTKPPKESDLSRDRVLEALRVGQWVPGYELTSPEIGGSEGLRRLRELRAQGHRIEKQRVKGSSAYEYRLV